LFFSFENFLFAGRNFLKKVSSPHPSSKTFIQMDLTRCSANLTKNLHILCHSTQFESFWEGVWGNLFSKKGFPNKKIPHPILGRKDSVVPPKLPQGSAAAFRAVKGTSLHHSESGYFVRRCRVPPFRLSENGF